MAIESSADRTAFVTTFGVAATVGGVDITAIFDNEYLETLDTASSDPTLIVVTSDVPSVAYGDAVTVASASFTGTVRSVQPDSHGMTVLVLGSD